MIGQILQHSTESKVLLESTHTHSILRLCKFHVFEHFLKLVPEKRNFLRLIKANYILSWSIILILYHQDNSTHFRGDLHKFDFIDFFLKIDLDFVVKNHITDSLISTLDSDKNRVFVYIYFL